jgi:hypothetical protein
MASSEPLDWERIALTAEQHGISGLIYRNLNLCQSEGLKIPANALQKLKLSVYKNAVLKERQTERLIRALSFLKDRNLEVMLIKGAALDCCVYQNPDYVLSDDIDIIIRARREEMSSEQYKEILLFFHHQGIEFELFMHHDIDINGLLPIDFTSIWEESLTGEYHGYPIRLMSTTDLLVSLCINSSRKRYFRLKSICGIRETIQTLDINWQQVAERAHRFQCENIVFTALLVASLTTGASLPLGWEAMFGLQPLQRSLIRAAVTHLIKHVSFYPYPISGISFLGRPVNSTLFLPYIGYTRAQVVKKVSYAFRVHGPQ